AKLFGAGGQAVRKQLELDRSALDLLLESSRSLESQLGQQDRRTMDEYLGSVRSLERDVIRSQAWLHAGPPAVEQGHLNVSARATEGDARDYMRVMYDLVFHAFRTDTTRIATYQVASMHTRASSLGRWANLMGLRDAAHNLAHNAGKKYEAKCKY